MALDNGGVPLGVKAPVQHFIYYLTEPADELRDDPAKMMEKVAEVLNGIVNQHRSVMHDAQCVAIFEYKDGIAITVEMRAHRG